MSKKQCVLVVGGAGYVGSHANKELHKRGYDTVVFDNLATGHRRHAQWGDFVLGDIGDERQLDLLFSQHKIDAVMHFAAFSQVGESVQHPERYYINNVSNTLKLLNAMRKYDVNALIFSSTCATYGVPQHLPLTEEHPQAPINPYGRSKLMMEQIMSDYSDAYGLKFSPLRYFNAAGADLDGAIGETHDPETHLIPLVFHAALGKRPALKIFGTDYDTPDGACIRDFIHVTDLADAHILALEYLQNGGASDAFNLGYGEGYSVLEVLAEAEKVCGRPIPTEEAERRAGDPAQLVGSSAKAEKVLSWKPKFSDLNTILSSAWAWHEKNG